MAKSKFDKTKKLLNPKLSKWPVYTGNFSRISSAILQRFQIARVNSQMKSRLKSHQMV